ncbi:uncharacterized protein A4U43_C07F22140 [Asparagus officinalis]|uniref:UDP-N-acetylmuramoyl-L-alanyl-D-glutamate--2,6-diaminopimelate ligase MurE homolog, chloroplastic n=1 Tax=Asparagus officinalis TaxID=4686 RepID=A0A5P1EDY4_ASPOF|nr:uncharacterized protein LOC109850376 [Asparagus officinalis]ONK64106.1 uncharacterized protein A4U43_C07F22140 [Asparagus officinalis]
MALNALHYFNLSKPSFSAHPLRRTLGGPFVCSSGVHRDEKDGNLGAISLKRHNLGKQNLPSSSDFYRSLQSEFQVSIAELMHGSGIAPQRVFGDMNALVTGIQIDSRKVRPGDLFICCVGSKTDGHMYVGDAIRRGAVAVLASKMIDFDEISSCGAVFIVENTNLVLSIVAANFYKNPSKRMSVIGITGTNGKTTTAHLVKAIHETMGIKTGMFGTVGYYINGDHPQLEVPNTTPDAITVQELMAKMVQNGSKALVMEASSHGLALGRCDDINFNVAVFTNLTRDHYDFHRSEEEYRNCKGKLFEKMVDPNRHHKVVNVDDPHSSFFLARGNKDVPIVTFGIENKDADVFPIWFKLSLSRTEVLISTPGGILEISSGLIGKHNVYNILAAVAVGISIAASLEEIKRGIENVDGVSGRFEIIDGQQPFGVVVDFAHTPDALARVLDTVREMGAKRIITVFGCAGESDRGKRSIMTKIAADKSEVVILTSDNPKTENPLNILDDMLAGVGWNILDYVQYSKHADSAHLPNGHRLYVHDIRRVAIRTAVAMAEKGDIVVVAGRGHETYQLEGNIRRYIDDREECREALHYVDKLHRAGLHKPDMVMRESQISFCKDVEAWNASKGWNDPSLFATVC